MATTKKSETIDSVEREPIRAAAKPKEGMNKQNIITTAIVSAVVLFFIGLGLGYLLGHSTVTDRQAPGLQMPSSNNNGRRSSQNTNTRNNDDTTDNNTDSDANSSQTQTN